MDSTVRRGDATGASRQDDARAREQLDDWLDEALEATFPASDPIATPPPFTERDRAGEAGPERASPPVRRPSRR